MLEEVARWVRSASGEKNSADVRFWYFPTCKNMERLCLELAHVSFPGCYWL